jgi:hypothetical protein
MRQGFLRAVTLRLAAIVLAVGAFGPAGGSPAQASGAFDHAGVQSVQAFGDETFGCRIAPGFDPAFRPLCTNTKPSATYNVAFLVGNLSGGGYSFMWQISGTFSGSVSTGCGPADSICGLNVLGGRRDSVIEVTVTFSQAGQPASRYATAMINAYCGSQLC